MKRVESTSKRFHTSAVTRELPIFSSHKFPRTIGSSDACMMHLSRRSRRRSHGCELTQQRSRDLGPAGHCLLPRSVWLGRATRCVGRELLRYLHLRSMTIYAMQEAPPPAHSGQEASHQQFGLGRCVHWFFTLTASAPCDASDHGSTSCCPLHAGPLGRVMIDALKHHDATSSVVHFPAATRACCDDLWAMQQLRQENPDLQLCVLDAMCLGELHLPAAVADMKLHQLAHLAFDADPGYGTVRTSGHEWERA